MHSEKSILGLSTLDGTLSPDEFRVGAHNFAEKWERVCHSHDHDLPLWSWVSCENPTFVSPNEVGGYLSSEKMCILRSDKTDDDGICHVREEEPNSFENRDSSDPAALVLPTHEVHYYDFHIVYNNSYRIPVLYFRGYHCDGQPLLLDEIEKDLPANSAKLLTESKWTFITQEEHPHLNRPWFTLHPCGTNELMRILLSNTCLSKDEVMGERYLISWVSLVSQVVGLSIPLQMASFLSDVQLPVPDSDCGKLIVN